MSAKRFPETDPLGDHGDLSALGGEHLSEATSGYEKWQPSPTDALESVQPGSSAEYSKWQPDPTDALSGGAQPLSVQSATVGGNRRRRVWIGAAVALLLLIGLLGGILAVAQGHQHAGTSPQQQPTATSQSGLAVAATSTPVLTPTSAPKPTATSAPRPTPTSAPKPLPTSTSAPSCQVFVTGSTTTLNQDETYVNLDTATGSVTPIQQSGDDIHLNWTTTTPKTFGAVNGATLANLGTSVSFNSLSCSQLVNLPYGSSQVPAAPGEVFAVKTPSGHYVKVEVGGTSTQLQLQWVTYNP
jgi:hypothetical protein